MTDDDVDARKDHGYSYRPSLLGMAWEFKLTPKTLIWSVGRRAGELAYERITTVQLMFRPGTVQQGTFVAYISSSDTPKITISSSSRKNLVEVGRQDAPYRDFILALHAHLLAAGVRPRYVRGVKPYVYWPGLVLMAAASLGFALLVARALQTQAWAGAGFIAAFLAMFLWQLGGYFRRNRPGQYRPDDVPKELLPDP